MFRAAFLVSRARHFRPTCLCPPGPACASARVRYAAAPLWGVSLRDMLLTRFMDKFRDFCAFQEDSWGFFSASVGFSGVLFRIREAFVMVLAGPI